MRTASLGKAACWAVMTVLISCCFEQVAVAQGRNEAVLNRAFTRGGGPSEAHWVWRDKKQQAPGDGIEGFEAYVRPDKDDPTEKAEITIRLYDAPNESSGPIMNRVKMELSETYRFILLNSNEANGRGRRAPKNQSFHFVLKSQVRNADGSIAVGQNERLFFITGTGKRETGGNPRDQNRTFRLTTLVIKNEAQPVVGWHSLPGAEELTTLAIDKAPQRHGTFVQLATAPGSRESVGCSDYPDDAVMEEEVYSSQETADPSTPPSQPDEVSWLTYTW